jgi:RimJ/RimL family protein N-acetyltransferase
MPDTWSGDKVRLRAWEPADWQAEQRWSRDWEGQRTDYRVQFPRSDRAIEQQAKDFALERPEGDKVKLVVALLDGTAIGVLTTDNCSQVDGRFSYGVYIEPEQRRHGYAAEAIVLLLRYYFDELRYQKANAVVFDFNEASARLQEKLGFRLEGRLRSMHYTNGAFCDELCYGITVAEFHELHG